MFAKYVFFLIIKSFGIYQSFMMICAEYAKVFLAKDFRDVIPISCSRLCFSKLVKDNNSMAIFFYKLKYKIYLMKVKTCIFKKIADTANMFFPYSKSSRPCGKICCKCNELIHIRCIFFNNTI